MDPQPRCAVPPSDPGNGMFFGMSLSPGGLLQFRFPHPYLVTTAAEAATNRVEETGGENQVDLGNHQLEVIIRKIWFFDLDNHHKE